MKLKSVIKKRQETEFWDAKKRKVSHRKKNKGGGANALTAVGQQGAMLLPQVSLADSKVHTRAEARG